MEVLDDGDSAPKKVGTKVIGSTVSASCSDSGMQTLTLSYTESVTESIEMAISKVEEYNWSVASTLSITTSANIFGSGGTFTAGLTVSSGGSYSLTATHSKTFSTSSSTTVGHETAYFTPGGAILYGVADQFKIDRSKVPVRLHMECPNEDDYVKNSTISLRTKTYPSAKFWYLIGMFNSTDCAAANSDKSEKCVYDVRNRYSYYYENEAEVKEAFDKCFGPKDGECSCDGEKGI